MIFVQGGQSPFLFRFDMRLVISVLHATWYELEEEDRKFLEPC